MWRWRNRPTGASSGNKPVVSVAMPVFNNQATIADAIDSILGQTLPELELIIVDGSTDGTSAVIDAIAARDGRVRVFRRPNQGVAAGRNLAALMARSGLIANMDSDDIALPDRLRKQVDFLAGHPEIGALGGQVRMIDVRGRVYGPPSGYMLDPDAIEARLADRNSVANPTAMFRRDLMLRVGGCRRAFEYAEDYDLWLRMAEISRLANLPDVLVHYRYHETMTSVRHARKQALAAAFARLSARQRRQTGVDPLAGLARLDWTVLDLLDLSPDETLDLERMLERIGDEEKLREINAKTAAARR